MDNSECEIQKNSKSSSKKSLSTTFNFAHCGKRTISEMSIFIFDEQLRMCKSTKPRRLPPTAIQQGTTEQHSQAPDESYTKAKIVNTS